MPDPSLIQLASDSAFSFTGTVQDAAMADPSGASPGGKVMRVRVEAVLHAPDALAGLSGQDVLVHPAADAEVMAPGASSTFFTDPVAFTDHVIVQEVARAPVEAAEPEVAGAMALGMSPHLSIRQRVEAARIQQHAQDADALVVGIIQGLEKAGPARFAEHGPDWWRANPSVDP